jgi:predicted AlkP superfamily phosphohydrolase/phosphomutase
MKTLILGLDAFDPSFFELMHNQGELPNLGKFVKAKGYSRFRITNPPQSEVSWTSIATGLNPGEHGIFDFVHRDPNTYNLYVSLLPTERSLGGIQFTRPHTARTIFDVASDRGYPATSLWWPATFPARPESPVQTLPGLGTPDIRGRLGVGAFYSSNPDLPDKMGKTPVYILKAQGSDRFTSYLEGPLVKNRSHNKNVSIDLEISQRNEATIEIRFGDQVLRLQKGAWSPIVALRFKTNWIMGVYAITRLIVTQTSPHIQFYVLPLQLHPLHALWRYGTPASFVNDSWKTCGPYLTLGWPQDTTALEDGCISDEQFLDLCNTIHTTRAKLLMYHLESFREGLLASVFDTLDRLQHMYWKTRPDVIQDWYRKLDNLVGQVLTQLKSQNGEPTRLLVVSDHGFKDFDYKINLNRWLIEQGYLFPIQERPTGDLKSVDWSRTKAYAIGLNSIYLNLAGREGKGIVSKDESLVLCDRLRNDLLSWKNSNHQSVVRQAWRRDETFNGELSDFGPDLVVGFSSGYRASADTGLGSWKPDPIEINHDHWGADHCFDSNLVPGVLFSESGLSNISDPSYRDFPALSIDATPDARGVTPPKTLSNEDQEKVEERLRSLGYL